jgi:hypothetical protein
MIKKSTTLIVFLLISLMPIVKGEVVIGIAWGGTHAISSQVPSDAVPYNHNDRSVHLQFLYTASELILGGAPGTFTMDSIGWYVYSQIGGPLRSYTIRMKNTTAVNTQSYDSTGLVVVRNAADLNPATDTSWYMIKLDSPFQWDGTSNLLIDVCWGVNATSSATGQIRHFSMGNSFERILVKNNSTNMCSQVPSQTAMFKPYIRITETSSTNILDTKADDTFLYPNPVHDKFTIRLNKPHSKIRLRVWSQTGALVEEKEYSSSNELVFEMNYSPGIYFLDLLTEDGVSEKIKLIKLHQ